MANQLLRQLQSTTNAVPAQKFLVLIVAFGKVFEGTITSHKEYFATLDTNLAEALQVKPGEDPFNVLNSHRNDLGKALSDSAQLVDPDLLYLTSVTIGSQAKCNQISLPFNAIDAWSFVAGHRKAQVQPT